MVSHVRFEGDSISEEKLRAKYEHCIDKIADIIAKLREVERIPLG